MPEPNYCALLDKIVEFRAGPLQGKPSDRTLAAAVGGSPTKIGYWLRGERFPQEIDPLLRLIRAVRTQAVTIRAHETPDGVVVLDERLWRRAYADEAHRRAEGTQTAVEVAQARIVLAQMRPGRPLADVTDPFQLEVHRAISSSEADLPVLPEYVEREHDRILAEVVNRATDGQSRIAVLVGGSATGKTRTLWEALGHLRERSGAWRVWHPIEPTRPDAVLNQLANVGAHTVIWLNEAQEYLSPDGLGEKVAASLRSVLHDPSRAPVLVLATLWPDHWNTLTTRTRRDPHSQARELLDGHQIRLPDAFTDKDLAALAELAGRDSRLEEAGGGAHRGQIVQYLAGVPVLMDRYHTARSATRALIDAAMDARRLGAGPNIPLAWLAKAAPGYLDDTEWNATSDDWLAQSLEYVTQDCNGIPGILTPVKDARLRNQRTRRPAADTGLVSEPIGRDTQGPQFQLADYVAQYGRRHRTNQIPPVDFWTAAASHAHHTDLNSLGDAAWDRGLYRDSAQLHKHATAYGNPHAATSLVVRLRDLHPDDPRPALWAAEHLPLDDPQAVARLLYALREARAKEQAGVLAVRAAAHVALDDPDVVVELLRALSITGTDGSAEGLLARDPAAHVSLDDPGAVTRLLSELARRRPFDDGQAGVLAGRAAAHVALDDPDVVAELLRALQSMRAGNWDDVLLVRSPAAHVSLDDARAVARLLFALGDVRANEHTGHLATRAATHTTLDSPAALFVLLDAMREVGARNDAHVLAARVAAHVTLDDPDVVADLLEALRNPWAAQHARALMAREPATHVALDNPAGLRRLMDALREAGAGEQADALAARAVEHVNFDDPAGLNRLMDALREAGAGEQADALATKAAAHVALDDPGAVARLLEALHKAQAGEQTRTLLARDPTAHIGLTNPGAVYSLMQALRAAGAGEEADALAARAAAHVILEDPYAVAGLLSALEESGAAAAADVLAARAATHVSLDDHYAVAMLLKALRKAGNGEHADTLLARDPTARLAFDDPGAVATLLNALRRAGAGELASALATRAAAHVTLDNPGAVAMLLNTFWLAGAGEEVGVLAERVVAHVAPDNLTAVTTLLDALRSAGASEQAGALARGLPAAGRFAQFCQIISRSEEFRFGREPDGSAVEMWAWEDLD
ncbi:hypothetical protein ABZ835_48465 [Streptomyces sp. NPDC047461]|uniref:hypothetical protein n=1 Tax=Streptomyces sp. NPDC047461 TaxID=3155619 RepID=UPI00340B1F4A